jgi:K+/H+ antiporter YhaU regulatory subunit KhtT
MTRDEEEFPRHLLAELAMLNDTLITIRDYEAESHDQLLAEMHKLNENLEKIIKLLNDIVEGMIHLST